MCTFFNFRSILQCSVFVCNSKRVFLRNTIRVFRSSHAELRERNSLIESRLSLCFDQTDKIRQARYGQAAETEKKKKKVVDRDLNFQSFSLSLSLLCDNERQQI